MSAIEIPGYKIIKTLGVGGQATVYLAIQEGFDREVALKVMSPALAADPTFGERFIREAKIVAKLAHSRIVTVFDVGESGNFYYLAMEYMRGKELKARISAGLKTKEALTIIAKLAAALHFAHEKGYIHRDVKSENILFDENNQPVLTDFGIAKASNSSTQMTQTGKLIGTPEYMSPEQCRGKKLDGRSDLYSLGIILFEMMTGSVPFTGEDSVSICIKHVTKPVPQLPARLNHLQWIINSLLDKNPNARFQTGQELADALKEFIVTGNQTTTSGSVSRVSDGVAKTVISKVVNQPTRRDDFDDEDFELSDEFNLDQRINVAPETKSKIPLVLTLLVIIGVGVAAYFNQNKWLSQFKEMVSIPSSPSKTVASKTAPKKPAKIESEQTSTPTEEIESSQSTLLPNDKNEQKVSRENADTSDEVTNEEEDIEAVDRVSQLIQRADTLAQYTPHELKDIEQALDNLTTAKSLDPTNENVTVTRGNIIQIALNEAIATANANKFNAANDWIKLVEIADRDNRLLPETKNNVAEIKSKYEQDLAKREEDAKNLKIFLDKGIASYKKGRLGAPEKDNAVYYYKAALKIEPENQQASDGLRSVSKKYLALIEQAIKVKEFSKARRYVVSLKSIPRDMTEDIDIPSLDSKVTKAKNIHTANVQERKRLAAIAEKERLAEEARQAKRADPLILMQLNSNLQSAKQLFDEGNLVTPYGNNALERYEAVLKIDPKDEEALIGIQAIESTIIQNLDVSISNNIKSEATKWLDALSILKPEDGRIPNYTEKLNAIEDLLPSELGSPTIDSTENNLSVDGVPVENEETAPSQGAIEDETNEQNSQTDGSDNDGSDI
ncbi:MAG: protein kinase domain-containing protein [Kangiellaceae bacterium]